MTDAKALDGQASHSRGIDIMASSMGAATGSLALGNDLIGVVERSRCGIEVTVDTLSCEVMRRGRVPIRLAEAAMPPDNGRG